MTTQDWCNRALDGNVVTNIGQLDRATVRALDKLAKAGKLTCWKEPWLGCIGRPRKHWRAP